MKKKWKIKKMNNRINIRLTFLIVLILISSDLFAQETNNVVEKNHTIMLKTQFFQFKDEFNYGLTFSGINLMAAYSFINESERNLFSYDAEIGFGGSFNKGAGLAWRFKPVDLFYGYKLPTTPFTIGAYVAADYQWQQYSELQGGRLFWFSSIEIGPQVRYLLPFKSNLIAITFSNSLAGLAARPEPTTETYFYEFSFSEFLSTSHENLIFGSANLFNRTFFEIELKKKEKKRFSLAYQFEYFGYFQNPNLSFLNHSINLKLNLGQL
jgi:hypothetical protein